MKWKWTWPKWLLIRKSKNESISCSSPPIWHSMFFSIQVYLQNLINPRNQKTSTQPNDSYDISHEPSNWRKDFACGRWVPLKSSKSLAVFDKSPGGVNMQGVAWLFCVEVVESGVLLLDDPFYRESNNDKYMGCFLKWTVPPFHTPKWTFLDMFSRKTPWLLGKSTILGRPHMVIFRNFPSNDAAWVFLAFRPLSDAIVVAHWRLFRLKSLIRKM